MARPWRVAKSLLKLRDQINEAYPNRNKKSDGTIGDAAHASRKSDHNPWIRNGRYGVVSALDITNDPRNGVDSSEFADYLKEKNDPRVKYLVSDRRIWNPRISNKWRKYRGKNPHTQHFHLSVKPQSNFYDDDQPWDIPLEGTPRPDAPQEDDRPILKQGARGQWVRNLQKMLSASIDGIFGPLTKRAVVRFQNRFKLVPDGIVGPYTWEALDKEVGEDGVVPRPEFKGGLDNVVATVFGGRGNPEPSAYENRMITDDELGVALPLRFKGERPRIRVINRANGKEAVGEIVDVGPWYIDDPYWETPGKRPLAETERIAIRGVNKGRRTNRAGIDLTQGLARMIGIKGMGYVDWEFE